jgi:putative FmdB family regulatory protein
MPIFEYQCNKCGFITSQLVLSPRQPAPVCKGCGSGDITKLISRVNMRLSEETRLERLADPAILAGVDENDPRSVAKVMKKMGGMLGDEAGGDFDHMVEEAMEEVVSEKNNKLMGEDSCQEF